MFSISFPRTDVNLTGLQLHPSLSTLRSLHPEIVMQADSFTCDLRRNIVNSTSKPTCIPVIVVYWVNCFEAWDWLVLKSGRSIVCLASLPYCWICLLPCIYKYYKVGASRKSVLSYDLLLIVTWMGSADYLGLHFLFLFPTRKLGPHWRGANLSTIGLYRNLTMSLLPNTVLISLLHY